MLKTAHEQNSAGTLWFMDKKRTNDSQFILDSPLFAPILGKQPPTAGLTIGDQGKP
jgi:hypothetical protein